MSGWIKFWKDMPSDPRVLGAAQKLSERYVLAVRTPGGGTDLSSNALCNAWRNAVVGALATLWTYADEHIRDDDTLPLTSQTVDAVVGLEGFFAVMPREWIDELDDGSIVLPGYCEKNSLIAKRKRAVKSNARVTRWRRGNNAQRNGVTSTHVTQHIVAGDLDQDLYKDKKEEEGSARASARHATRLPDDFLLTPERRAVATTERIDPERTFAKFVDHWKAKSGQGARKADWDATWRNWCRNETDRNGASNGTHRPSGPPRLSALERVRLANAEALDDDPGGTAGGQGLVGHG
jgi:hypothetical protein